MNIQKVDLINAPYLEGQLSYIGLDSWMNFVHEMYAHKIHRFVAEENNQIVGALSLAEIKHPVFGHYLATAPFGSYGGFAFQNESAKNKLLDSAKQHAVEIEAEYVSIRFDESASPPPSNWLQHPVYQTYLIDLNPNPDDLLKRFSSDHRNHIRKSLKKGFQIRFGHLDLLDDAYEAIAKSMHELGSPYHAKNYLRKMAEALGNTLEFAVMYDSRGKITGGGVFIYQDKTIFNLHANILHFSRSNYAGEFLYWSVIEHAIQKGCSTFDLGRSLIGSGNDIFKSKWAPQKKLLSYWYWLAKGNEAPSLNQKSPKFQFAIAVWKRLPSFVVRLIGPYLIRGLV
ncbi:MAG: peptidoglycan bridge formation glycyltransferase FemA/FemB family protein [Anaerolineales bacterium]|nr:peptidoglycan bridge formation glycyltransferase FemA/FemB family protein [Anaerolineales bacterium]